MSPPPVKILIIESRIPTFSRSVALSSLHCIVEGIPADKLVLSLYYILRLPVYQPVDPTDISETFRRAVTPGSRSLSDFSIALHLLGEGMVHRILNDSFSLMQMPYVTSRPPIIRQVMAGILRTLFDLPRDGESDFTERSRRICAERLAWTALEHNANIDVKLWMELLASIGQCGGPQVQHVVERMTERAVVEEGAACEEVKRISTSGPIEVDLAAKFIEEAQRLVQRNEVIHTRTTCTATEPRDIISPSPSPLILCAPPSTPTQAVHITSPIIASTIARYQATELISSQCSLLSTHSADDDDDTPSRRFFVTNPDASVSQNSLKRSDSLDTSEASVSEEVPSLAYTYSWEEAKTCDTPNHSKKSSMSNLEVVEDERSARERRAGIKRMLARLAKKVGRVAVRRVKATKSVDGKGRRILLI